MSKVLFSNNTVVDRDVTVPIIHLYCLLHETLCNTLILPN